MVVLEPITQAFCGTAMSTSDSEPGDESAAEPVDAEFEPAPDSREESPASSKPVKPARRGAGWFKVSLFVVFAATIGGGAGWLTGQVLDMAPFGETAEADLSARVAALETSAPTASASGLDALQARIGALEESQNASGLRADAVEQLVRDVAALRTRIETLEARPAPAPGEGGSEDSGQDGAALEAIDGLEMRMADAFAEVETRLETALETAGTAQAAAEEALSAAQQAQETAAQSTPGDAASTGSGSAGQAAAEVAALRTALTALEDAQQSAEARLGALEDVPAQIEALERSVAEANAPNPGLARLGARVDALETALARAETLAQDAAQTRAGQARAELGLAQQALAFAALSDAASQAQPFAVPFADLVRVWPQAPQRAALAPVARSGAPTLDGLTSRFPGEALRAASGEAQTFFGVLRVQRDGTQGPAAAIEAALNARDLEGALTVAETLEGEAGAAIADWRAQAQARRTIETALTAMAGALQSQQERSE
jgi:hypothetical protein